jgi:hypothetical protein
MLQFRKQQITKLAWNVVVVVLVVVLLLLLLPRSGLLVSLACTRKFRRVMSFLLPLFVPRHYYLPRCTKHFRRGRTLLYLIIRHFWEESLVILYSLLFVCLEKYKNIYVCAQSEIWGCYCTIDEGYCLLEHDTVQSGKMTFWRDRLPPSFCAWKADVASFSFASLKSKYYTHGKWCRGCVLVEIRRCLEIPWSRTQQVSTKLAPRHISEDRTLSLHNCKMLDEWPFSHILTSFWSLIRRRSYMYCLTENTAMC